MVNPDALWLSQSVVVRPGLTRVTATSSTKPSGFSYAHFTVRSKYSNKGQKARKWFIQADNSYRGELEKLRIQTAKWPQPFVK